MDNETCGIIMVIVTVLFLIYAVGSSQQNSDAKQSELLEKQRSRLASTMDNSAAIYSIVYLNGHKGIDHYLRYYLKRESLIGTLSLTDNGVSFLCSLTKTPQKLNLPWSEVKSATTYVDAGLFSEKQILCIYTTGDRGISFKSDEGMEIAKQISLKISRYVDAANERRRLEDEQIIARNLDAISPSRFEGLVGEIFQSMGYYVQHTGGTSDEGIDLICKRESVNEKIIVQCKRYQGNVGVSTVRDLYGAITHSKATKGYIVTTSDFTKPAVDFAKGKPIELINRIRLSQLLDKHLSRNT